MEEGQATGAGHKPSQAEILANMGVSSLPAKKQDPLLAELEARYEAECEKVGGLVVYVRGVGARWWCRVGGTAWINPSINPIRSDRSGH